MLFCEACENATYQPAVLMRGCRPGRSSVQPFLRALCCKACRPGFPPALVRPADERVGRAWKETMLRLTHEELSRVQDLCRVLPRWKARQILQALARRASSAVSIMSSGRLDCPRRIGAERVVDTEDPGAVWQLPTHLHAMMVHLDIDGPPSSA